MIVVDTSVWVDHFKGIATALEDVLQQELEVLHPFVFGELLLGGLPGGGVQRSALEQAAPAVVASAKEVAAFITWAKLAGTGVGYVDVHLLVSAKLGGGHLLTSDGKLHAQAERLGVAFNA